MSYKLVIEGAVGIRRVESRSIPRTGEWLHLEVEELLRWFPVVEVIHRLGDPVALERSEDDATLAHEEAETYVLSSIALSVVTEPRVRDEAYKLLLPPTRWPAGGRFGGRYEIDDCELNDDDGLHDPDPFH